MNSTNARTLVLGTIGALAGGPATPVLADDVAAPSLQQRLQNVTERLQELEGRSTAPEGRLEHAWEALLEFEAARVEDGDGNTTSEMALATMELGVTSRIRDGLETNVLLQHEPDEDFGVDSATIDANLNESDGSSTDTVLGLQYLPFGDYYTHFVSDPLTLELGETREGAVRLHHRTESMYAGAWLADGKTSDTIDNQGGDGETSDALTAQLAVAF